MNHLTTKKGDHMAQSIPNQTSRVNTESKFSGYKQKTQYIVSGAVHKALVKDKHLTIAEFLKTTGKKYSNNGMVILKAIINCTDINGVGSPSISTLALKSGVCERTIKNYIAIFIQDGVLSKKKNGWKKTNTLTLLPIQHKLNHKEAKLACDLNSSLNLEDRDLTLPLKEDRHKSNLEESIREYEAYEREMAVNEVHQGRKRGVDEIEMAIEACQSLPEPVKTAVLYQARDYQLKEPIRYPRAFIRALVEKEIKKHSEGIQVKDEQELFREQARKRIEQTRRMLDGFYN